MMTSVNSSVNDADRRCVSLSVLYLGLSQDGSNNPHLLPCELALLELGFTTRIAMTKLKSNRSIYVRR